MCGRTSSRPRVPTLAAVVLTSRWAIVVDTLTGPDEMAPVLEFLAAEAGDRRRLVVNAHHHWTTCSATPRSPAGHRRPARLPAPDPGGTRGRRRVPAAAAAGGRAAPDHHLRRPSHLRRRGPDGPPHPHPGHSEDRWSSSSPKAGCRWPATPSSRRSQSLPARRARGVGPHPAPAQAASGRPRRAGARPDDRQAHHRRQRADADGVDEAVAAAKASGAGRATWSCRPSGSSGRAAVDDVDLKATPSTSSGPGPRSETELKNLDIVRRLVQTTHKLSTQADYAVRAVTSGWS